MRWPPANPSVSEDEVRAVSERLDEVRRLEHCPPADEIRDPYRGPVDWMTVRTLREAGLHDCADIAERYVRADERRRARRPYWIACWSYALGFACGICLYSFWLRHLW